MGLHRVQKDTIWHIPAKVLESHNDDTFGYLWTHTLVNKQIGEMASPLSFRWRWSGSERISLSIQPRIPHLDWNLVISIFPFLFECWWWFCGTSSWLVISMYNHDIQLTVICAKKKPSSLGPPWISNPQPESTGDDWSSSWSRAKAGPWRAAVCT